MNGTKIDITPNNCPRHELVRLEVDLIDSSDESQIGSPEKPPTRPIDAGDRREKN
ncbi:MAG: hypothetical protein ACI9SF_000038 [Candidatus Nanohaloarchaea archaeon]|jgi:hypothetical protein